MKLQNKIVIMPILATLFIGIVIYAFYKNLEEISNNLIDKEIPQTIYAYEMKVSLQKAFNNILEDIDSKNYLDKTKISNNTIEEFKKYLNSFRNSKDIIKLEVVDLLENDLEKFINLSEKLYLLHNEVLKKVIERSKIINDKLENIIDDKFQLDLDKNDLNYDEKLAITYEVEINLFEYVAAARGLLVTNDKLFEEKMENAKKEFFYWLDKFFTLALSSSQLETANEIIKEMNSIVFLSIEINKKQEIKDKLMKEYIRFFQVDMNKHFNDSFQKEILSEIYFEKQNLKDTLNSQIISVFIILFIWIILIFLFSKKSAIDIKRLTKGIKEFDTNKVSHIKVDSKDELAFLAQTFNKLQDDLYQTNKINDSYQKGLEEQNEFVQTILDHQPTMIMIINEKEEPTFVNKTFLEFYSCFDLNDFKKIYGSIGNTFIKNDIYFYLEKVKSNIFWVEYLKQLEEQKRIVSILSPANMQTRAFKISIAQYETEYMLTFTDISETILKQIQLEDKTIKDKLTKVFNREYFEQNYQKLIDEFKVDSYKFALAILDLDFFKNVNDTFGHDVGDEVLVHFASTVKKFSRKDDYLIRWGGEEFIVILKIHSDKDLNTSLEHLRVHIENEIFPKVGNITCSIGATIYKDEENIETTIKRADDSLYEAKRSGRNRVVIS